MLKKLSLYLISIGCGFIFVGPLFSGEISSPKNELDKIAEEVAISPACIDQLKKGALNGNLSFQFLLGYMYQTGIGVPQSYEQTAYWDSIAAERGLPGSQGQLGLMYYLGDGVPKDRIKAMMWLTIVASRQGIS